MKRIWLCIVSMILIFCLLPLNALAASKQVVRITHYQKVNVRSGPSTGYRTLGEVSPNEVFPYLGTQNGWNCIQYTSTQIGYVAAKYSKIETQYVSDAASGATSKAGTSQSSSNAYVKITHHQKVNVRYGPGSSYGYICEVSPKKTFAYMGSLNGWHCIAMDDGKMGFVYGQYASVSGRQFEAPGTVCVACGGDGQCSKCFSGKKYSFSGSSTICTTCFGRDICTSCYGYGFKN